MKWTIHNRKINIISLIAILIVIFLGGYLCYDHYQNVKHQQYLKSEQYQRHLAYVHKWKSVWTAKKHPTASNLAKLTINHPYSRAILYINHNHSDLSVRKWKYNHIHFSHKDKLGRLSYPATAYLDKKNATGDVLRRKQHVKPVGWHQKRYEGDWLLNRGHLIAYSLSKDINFKGKYTPNRAVGNLNDKRNLFTETSFCNQQLQYAFETKVRIALEKGYHVVYRVQPIFYHQDLMPKGVHIQALSTNHKLDFNVYLFNVQPGIRFNYKNGFIIPDSNNQFQVPKELITHSQYLDNHDKRMKLQRQIMMMFDNKQISYQQAYEDEEQVVGDEWINPYDDN